MSSNSNADPSAAALAAVGEMAALVRTKDWAATPLGPTSGWSPTLRVIVDTIMTSQFPMALRWGPDLVLVYNDG